MDDPEVLDMVRGTPIEFATIPVQSSCQRKTSFTSTEVSVIETRDFEFTHYEPGGICLSHFCSSQEGWYYQNDFKFEIFKSIGGVSSL